MARRSDAIHLAAGKKLWHGVRMSFTATVENDTIKLPPGVHLPDGTEVRIEPAPPAAPGGARAGTTLAERLAPFVGCLHSGVGDLADNHDHYLYGTPKQKP